MVTTSERARPRRALRAALAAFGGVFVVIAVLGAEVYAGASGIKLDERDAHLMDGLFDGPIAGPASGSSAKPVEIVWLGDSTAAGVGTSNEEGGMARQVARRLGRPVQVHNYSVSGARIADVRDQQLPKVLADNQHPDLVLMSIGANDATHLTSTGSYTEAYEAVIGAVPAGADLVVLGVPDLGSTTRLAQPLRAISSVRADQLGAVSRALAYRHDLAYVNIGAQTGPAFRADPTRLLASDGYHASDAGYAVWTEAIVPVVQWQLARREHPDQPAPPRPAQSQ